MKDFRPCLKGLIRTLRPFRGKVGIICLFGTVEVALSMSFVWASKQVIDAATGASPRPIKEAAAIMACIMICQVLIRVAARYWNGLVTIKATNVSRASVFEKVMRSTWDGQDRFHTGDTVNRLEEDMRVVVDFICNTLPNCVVTMMQLCAAATFLFIMEPQLAWILIFIMPAAVVGSRLFFKKMRQLTIEIRTGDSAVQSHMQENILQRILVKTLGGTSAVQSKLVALQDDVQAKTISRLNYGAIARAFMQVGFMVGYGVAFFWGAFGIHKGAVTYGMMVAFLQLVGQVQRPVAELAQYVPAFIRVLASEERLMELQEQPQEIESEPVRLEGAPGIRVEGLTFGYGENGENVLRGLDFDFKPGTMTAIIGSTGSGKSTLTKVIMALLQPREGKILLYDENRSVESSADTRCNFMYVPQGNSLMSGTIRQNMLLANPEATEEELKDALHIAAADFVLDLPSGMETACAEIGRGLSEGQAQRIAIARALLRPGGILILDEATSALDAQTEFELLNRISERYKGRKTILCITHRPAATSYADATLEIRQ